MSSNRSFRALDLLRVCAFCATVVLASPTPNARADVLALEPYWPAQAPGAVMLTIEIDGRPARMLFDTGAGVTAMTETFASSIGCAPYGRVSGFRMRGDRFDARKCGSRTVEIGGRGSVMELLAFDASRLLPAEAPPLDGIIGLDAFVGRRLTINLARAQLTLDGASREHGRWRRGRLRYERSIGGSALTVFVPAQAGANDLWMLLDSGHIGGSAFLSPAALDELAASRSESCVRFVIAGIDETCVPTTSAETLIYDGVLGEQFLRQFEVALDLRNAQIWRPAHGPP